NFEILFYKVFHNKYLFNYIIKQIQITEWIEYEDTDQINLDNRKRFKDIVSLKWMIKNKQYQLLKCKLYANELIDID
ncbi:hypothetical protein DICPUDRAFT_23830, partial [Dictyostelium purpureum]